MLRLIIMKIYLEDIVLKDNAPFRPYIRKINNFLIENVIDIVIVIPM